MRTYRPQIFYINIIFPSLYIFMGALVSFDKKNRTYKRKDNELNEQHTIIVLKKVELMP